jgi:hypothetical protein
MKQFLEPTDEGAFLDHAIQERTSYTKDFFVCPKCQAHGGWNLTVDAYGPGKHFRCVCPVCYGTGYTKSATPCEHDWQFSRNLGRCYNEYICRKCNAVDKVDSSD